MRRPNSQQDATAATLSFQRRNHAQKKHFLRRYNRTPLAVTTDYWDRTEEQKRGAEHSHTLFWAKRRKLQQGYQPRPSIPKREAGGEERRAPSLEGGPRTSKASSNYMRPLAEIEGMLCSLVKIAGKFNDSEIVRQLAVFEQDVSPLVGIGVSREAATAKLGVTEPPLDGPALDNACRELDAALLAHLRKMRDSEMAARCTERIAIEPGDAFRVHPGCDKRLDTCIDRFANVLNFRGEPYVPGQDAMMSYPDAR